MVNNALGVQAFSDFNTPLSHSGSIVVQVTQYIKENYNDPDISLNKLAERLHISPFHLSRLLRRELDTTFIDYVTKIRLEETVRLLREQPSKSIKEIAFQIGYEDPYYFSKVFRKFYKISPLHFRKQFL
jgi:two-component system response regulator YesN